MKLLMSKRRVTLILRVCLDPAFGPAVEPLEGAVPVTEPLGQVTPGGTGTSDPEHGVDEEAVVGGRPRGFRAAGQEVFDPARRLILSFVPPHRDRPPGSVFGRASIASLRNPQRNR